MLKDQDSPLDFMLRGFDQAAVLAQTGVDIGYHGAGLKTLAKGIDRFAYKVEHVLGRIGSDRVAQALAAYADGYSKFEVLRLLGLAGENTVVLCKLFTALDLAAEFKAADTARRTNAMREGMVTKYGTDNAFKLAEFQEKAGDTREKKYGARYTLADGSILAEGARETFIEKLADPEFAEDLRGRKAATNLERLGVPVPSQSPVVQAKIKATFQEKYGVGHPSQVPEARARHVDLMQTDGKRRAEVARATNLERYGVTNASQLPERREAQSQAMLETSVERGLKARETTRERYGVDHASQTIERRDGFSAFMVENGSEFARRSQETSQERYGVGHHQQLQSSRAAQSARMLDPEHQAQINAAKRANGTFNVSSPEATLHGLLVEHFGTDDVVTQYTDDRYPWLCDFYIPSRDLFIELNATWTHGGHWYDGASLHDQHQVLGWQLKGTGFYEAAVQQWSVRDTAKREQAHTASLNYVVFWDSKGLSDAELWLALGAPSGTDWAREYSWLPRREIVSGDIFPQELPQGSKLVTRMARAANGPVFHARELEMWHENQPARWGTTQGYLFANRFKHLGKLPDELSDLEILRGMSIAGMLRSYTVFDNTAMKQVIGQYGMQSIYDPCSGWGERLVTCAALNVAYRGTDINEAVVAGHRRIIEQYGLTEQSSWHGDAATVDRRGAKHDAVFTCPPYGSIEIYTEQGAENLSEEDFLAWWSRVVELSVSSSTRVFAYQINQKWKGVMNAVIAAQGWVLDAQIAVGRHQASHFNRRKNGVSTKVEFEEVQVFVRP